MPYQNMISCRLNDYDRDVLGEAVSRSGMSQSEYLRSLLRIPAEARSQTTVYAVDGKTMGKLATELIRWVYSSIKKSTFRSAGFRHFAGKRRRTSHPSLPISRASAPRPSSCSGR